ncbi:hypothetical protein [Amycolatopsis rhizosphaerae]|nr:hypothetical protein [Amycolatopsis rhizosphaerae]
MPGAGTPQKPAGRVIAELIGQAQTLPNLPIDEDFAVSLVGNLFRGVRP